MLTRNNKQIVSELELHSLILHGLIENYIGQNHNKTELKTGWHV